MVGASGRGFERGELDSDRSLPVTVRTKIGVTLLEYVYDLDMNVCDMRERQG